MTQNQMITKLKTALPYAATWYETLTKAQVFCLYQKYILHR